MSDSSKAEKIAAAKKKLKQFQSKAKAETTSINLQSSISNESSVNVNGDRKQSDLTQFQPQLQSTPSPPPLPPSQSSQQQQSINLHKCADIAEGGRGNLHFGAIDPVQFDSTKIFDQSQIAGNFFNQASNKSEILLNSVLHSTINNSANMPAASTGATPPPPPPPSSSHLESIPMGIMQQPPMETFSNLSMLQHQQQTSNPIGQYPSAMTIETANHSAILKQHVQELNDLLQVEKMRNHELSVKVTQQHSTIEGLTSELNELRKCATTITSLQQQVNAHIQTVNILVGEKSDLTAKLQQRDQRISDYESECVELQGRLKASRYRVAELEKDLSTLAQSHQKYDGSQQALCTELETLQEETKHLKRLHQDACDENTEFKHLLMQKTKEIEELKTVIGTKSSELEMVRVRVEQLTGGDSMQSIDPKSSTKPAQQDQQRLLDAERQVIELQNMISELTNDRDRTQQQYQTYVQHLTSETVSLTQRIQELTKANEKLTKREESLVNHVQELEKQIQKQISTQRRLAALRDEEQPKTDELNQGRDSTGMANTGTQNNNELIVLQEKLKAIEKEKLDLNALLQDHSTQKLSLQQQLIEKETKLTEIESELERLKAERPDTTNILATIESDKVAASRAMAQNQELRKQLEEMQNAFVQVSNDKAEFASQLQSEEYMNRDIRNRFGDLDNELKSIKEKLHFKDEEMIRLTHENTQYDAKIQELLKKLDTNSNDSVRQVTEIQRKLHVANKEIHRLRQKLQNNVSKEEAENGSNNVNECVNDDISPNEVNLHQHKHKLEPDHEHDHVHEHSEEHGHDHCNNDQNVALYDDTAIETSSAIEALDNSDVVSVTSTINIATNEAMDKLQARFKRTMNEIADLTEEKSRLEHLVTQLQSETETIGEYIALYQTQRRLLKQREIEKDVQLNCITADRAAMRDKLQQLNELVELLLTQKGISNAAEIMAKLNSTTSLEKVFEPLENANIINPLNGSVDTNKNVSPEHMKIPSTENNCHHHHHEDNGHGDGSHEHEHLDHNHSNVTMQFNRNIGDANTRETATKIINLLTDIKEKNLRQDYTIGPNAVDHCSCCSGKLEVV